jgi:hypothetical protein
VDDLLSRVLDAHGGLERWSAVNTLTTRLSVGGPFWVRRGFPDAFLEETLEIDARREHAVFTPWIAPDQSLTFDVAPERVTLQAADGQTVDSRTDPRSSYPRYEHNVFLRDPPRGIASRSATSSATRCGTTSPPRSCSPTPV